MLEISKLENVKHHSGKLAAACPACRADGRKRATKRCLDLLTSYLGAGGRDAFLKTSQPELEYKTGTELLDSNPDELLALIESRIEGGGY